MHDHSGSSPQVHTTHAPMQTKRRTKMRTAPASTRRGVVTPHVAQAFRRGLLSNASPRRKDAGFDRVRTSFSCALLLCSWMSVSSIHVHRVHIGNALIALQCARKRTQGSHGSLHRRARWHKRRELGQGCRKCEAAAQTPRHTRAEHMRR